MTDGVLSVYVALTNMRMIMLTLDLEPFLNPTLRVRRSFVWRDLEKESTRSMASSCVYLGSLDDNTMTEP